MTPSADPFEILKGHFPNLSDGQQRVARALLDEPAEVALLSTAALGQRVGVSDSTVVRMAGAVGYSGYPELRTAIHESLFRHLAPSEKFRRALRNEDDSALGASLRTDADNVGRLDVEAVHRPLAEAASLLASASAVYVAGSQNAFATAYSLYYLLGQIRKDVRLLSASGGDLDLQLLGVTRESAVVLFSLPRYSRETHTIAKMASGTGAKLVAVTNSLTSPVAQLAAITVTVSSNSASFFSSHVASMAVGNALAAEVAKRIPTQAEDRLERHDDIKHALGLLVLDRE